MIRQSGKDKPRDGVLSCLWGRTLQDCMPKVTPTTHVLKTRRDAKTVVYIELP